MEDLSTGHLLLLMSIGLLSFVSTVLIAVLGWIGSSSIKRFEAGMKTMFGLFDTHCKEDTANFKEVTALIHTKTDDALKQMRDDREQTLKEMRDNREQIMRELRTRNGRTA